MNCIPGKLFHDSTSTVLLDRNGQLLGAHISDDEQWRFEECKTVPSKFKVCIVQFEDRDFYNHWGVSVKGIARAVSQNFKSGRRVSGASTLTMQLVRLMRKNPPRTYSEKLYEMILATRIEWSYSKSEILRMYASHAPFGNNVVGLDAASWRFFGRPAEDLSWAESATLAVLPNAPGLIYPGRNQERLKAKRNRLLKRLFDIGKIKKSEYEMAILEPLPKKPHPLPNLAPHLLNKLILSGQKGRTVRSTLDKKVQTQTIQNLENRLDEYRENQIFNGAVVVTSVETGEILAYVGNSFESGREHSNQVNCIEAPRSTGSILKPFLYAESLESGVITPKMLLTDVPSKFGAFAPKNFAGDFNGLVPADECLSRSLNIPMVHLINRYGLTKFHNDLQKLGFTTINRSANHYGLSLILGGAEVTLFDLANVYTQSAQQLNSNQHNTIHFIANRANEFKLDYPIDRGCIYSTFEAMLEVKRPDEDNNWKLFTSSKKIAWKTGTSYGFRDAWAVGVTTDYVVSVWVGNADGEGRPGLTGVQAAAPILFDVFDQLSCEKEWFPIPFSRMKEVEICGVSGHRASQNCTSIRKERIPITSLETPACPYHQIIHLNKQGTKRVNSDCYSVENMKHESWFVIPSKIEKFYRLSNPDHQPLPEYDAECRSTSGDHSIAILYPRRNQRIYLPYDFNEERKKVVFEATHRGSEEVLFWHMDGAYFGQTSGIHQMEFRPSEGKHKLTIMDQNGNSRSTVFEMLSKSD